MKKIIIAGASAVLAAMPVVGAFAAADQASFTDHLTVSVDGGCTLETSGTQTSGTYADRTLSATIEAGTAEEITGQEAQTPVEGATITVTCNGADATKSWTVTVTPPTDGKLVSGTDYILPGDTFDGATSAWAIKSNAQSGTFSSDDWSTYAAAPTTASLFLKGSLAQGASGTFKPSYKVYVSPTQAPGTYQGDITYTVDLVNNN